MKQKLMKFLEIVGWVIPMLQKLIAMIKSLKNQEMPPLNPETDQDLNPERRQNPELNPELQENPKMNPSAAQHQNRSKQ